MDVKIAVAEGRSYPRLAVKLKLLISSHWLLALFRQLTGFKLASDTKLGAPGRGLLLSIFRNSLRFCTLLCAPGRPSPVAEFRSPIIQCRLGLIGECRELFSMVCCHLRVMAARATQAIGGGMSEAWSQWQGQLIDSKFHLKQYLGGSRHSGVFLAQLSSEAARGQSTDKPVAIRLIADSPNPELQLSRWRMAQDVAHPHLLRILETGR